MFTKELMSKIVASVLKMPLGAAVVTITKPLPLDECPEGSIVLAKSEKMRMSWGMTTVFIYCRQTPGASETAGDGNNASGGSDLPIENQ